ncbi:MAG TPA: hypothetical protein VFT72_19225 [Opitutaceae bacterium]|nr:hypothetical protein [Opitutaceae bacterium]
MAWRIETYVVRGEIDNRIRGETTGRLWFLGRKDPVELKLRGNACRDLAGRRLTFVNPRPKLGIEQIFVSEQVGIVGEITASRRVRVPEIPLEEIARSHSEKKSFPWHWGNGVYFEWHSVANGTVLIESADYQLTMADDAWWEMSAEEEKLNRLANHQAVDQFIQELGFLTTEAPESEVVIEPPEESYAPEFELEDDGDETWRNEPPLTEEEADELIADSDRLTDRLMERIDEAGSEADLESILEEELERRRSEAESADGNAEELPPRTAKWTNELIIEADAAFADAAELHEELESRHPLVLRARALTLRIMAEVDRKSARARAESGPVMSLVRSVTKAGGKLAGALDGRTWPPSVDECGLCIAWLKRSRVLLEDAALAADYCRSESLMAAKAIDSFHAEILALQCELDVVIGELRELLSRGFD